MITRIELTNFMSHAHTVIEPAAGLTVLVGPNNVGKSAVVAALQILCRNENSTYVLRHGAKECSVKVETDDGHRIEWRRKNSPSYVIDGQLFDRLKGSGLPDELHRALRLPKVDAGNDADFDVHFGIQKAPIFLLGSSPGNAAKFFASSSDVIRLIEIQKRHKEKLAEAQREKVRLDAESKQLDAELGLLEPAIELDRRLELVEATHAELCDDAARIAAAELCAAALQTRALQFARHAAEVAATARLQPPPELPAWEPLEQLIDALLIAERKQALAAGLSTALAGLSVPPALSDVAQPAQLIEELRTFTARVARDEGEARVLADLAAPPELGNSALLDQLSRQLADVERTLRLASTQCDTLQELVPPPELLPAEPLLALTASLSSAEATVESWEASHQLLARLDAPPVPAPGSELQKLLQDLTAADRRCREQQESAGQQAAALEECLQALRTAATGRTCDVCGSPFDPDRVVARAAAGMQGHDHG